MRFWSAFHRCSLDIISDCPKKLIFRAPNHIRLRMTADHLELNQSSGSCLTQYNHDTCLWECYHSPETTGHHRLFIWVLNGENDDQWVTAVRFDVYVKQKPEAFHYPITSDMFHSLRCQLITPLNGTFSRDALPLDIIIRAPSIRNIQLQIDEQTLIRGTNLQNNIYRLQIPSFLPDHVKNFVLMGLCSNDNFYSLLITYKLE